MAQRFKELELKDGQMGNFLMKMFQVTSNVHTFNGDEIAAELSMTRAAVIKTVQKIRKKYPVNVHITQSDSHECDGKPPKSWYQQVDFGPSLYTPKTAAVPSLGSGTQPTRPPKGTKRKQLPEIKSEKETDQHVNKRIKTRQGQTSDEPIDISDMSEMEESVHDHKIEDEDMEDLVHDEDTIQLTAERKGLVVGGQTRISMWLRLN